MEGCALSAHPSPILVALAAYGRAVRDLEKINYYTWTNHMLKEKGRFFFFRLELTQRRKQGINWCCLPNVRKIPQIIAIPTFMSLPGHHFVQVLITVMRRTLPIHTVVVNYAFFNWVSLWTSASCNFASGDRSSRMGSRLIFAFQAGHISYVWFRTFSALITFALECKVKSLLNH